MVSRRPSTRWSGARCSDRSSRSTRHRDGAPVSAAPADDIEAIRQLKARYFRTLDQKDWSGYRQVFASGWYEETYRRTTDGWLIATMRLRRHRVELNGVVIFPRN
ncbi:MAG: hypothetical protein EBY44_00365 [Actinobacteria bacterium]|nr:hypothetical protein [Actinomycetota bacterium]